MRKNGINNSVAVMGTSLTENHVNQLKCLTENVTLCFDNDNAGKIAFKRSLDIAGPHLNVAQLNIVNAKDPDEFLKKYGKDEFIKVLENSKNISKPENYEQQFDKNSTKISHRLSNHFVITDRFSDGFIKWEIHLKLHGKYSRFKKVMRI